VFTRVAIRCAEPVEARRIGDDHGQVPARPHHFGVQADGGKPPKLVVYSARLVVHVVDWCDDVDRILGYHDVAKDEPAARPEPGGDAGEQVGLTCTVEVVHGERRHDEVEVALGQRVLKTAHAKIGGEVCGHGSEHLRTLVDADQLCLWVDLEHPAGCLPGADAELEHPLGLNTGGGLGDGILQLVVRRHLLTDRLEIGGRIEVELVTIDSVDHGCSLAGTQQQSEQPFAKPGSLRFEFFVTGLADVALQCLDSCPKLWFVPEQNPGGLPAREPDHLIKWFIGLVVIGVGVNLLGGFVVAQKWDWLPAAVFVAALLVAVPSTGLLRRERYLTTRARRVALLALSGYLAVVVWGSVTGWPLSLMILSVVYLWEVGVMLTWPTLRNRADVDHVAVGAVCLLVGSAFLLLGVGNPVDASTLGMVAGLLVRVALLLLGAAALLLGVAVLLDTWALVRVPFLLFGVAALMGGIAALLDGRTLFGVALLLGPVTALLLGIAFLLDRWTLLGIPFLLGAVTAPLGGVAAMLAGWTLVGVTALLLGVAFLLGGVASFLNGWTLVGVPFVLFGVAALLAGVAAFLGGWTAVGVPFLLLGIAALLSGVALLYRHDSPQRLVAWLSQRVDLLVAVDGDERG
jgi:hypothetical protein